MTQNFDNKFDIRDKLIACLEEENKTLHELIKEQKTTIKILEEQVSESTKLLKKIIEDLQKG